MNFNDFCGYLFVKLNKNLEHLEHKANSEKSCFFLKFTKEQEMIEMLRQK